MNNAQSAADPASAINPRGVIYTFYSFKGGVGRSMAVANVAALLSKAGNKVLIIDWDLEAPGLEKYFSASITGSRQQSIGIVDIIVGFTNNQPVDWHSGLLYATPFSEGKQIAILTAGRDFDDYIPKLQSINWDLLFNEMMFGGYLEQLREEWIEEYDFILIDSRTGITDIGGICTIHLPDSLVLFFTANEQSVDGIKDVINRVWKRYKALPLDRSKLLAVPVPSRFETITENNLTAKWKVIFAEKFAELYQDWMPDKTTAADIVDRLFIPYVPFWSFGEGLPVVTEGTGSPGTLGFAYDLLARLLSNRLQWKESLSGEISLSSGLSPQLINQSLDSVYNALSDEDKELMRQLFFRLIKFDSANKENDMPVKANLSELGKYGQVIEKLLKSNVFFKNVNSATKAETIEISQKGIMTGWERLSNWISDDREFLVWRQDLNSKARDWDENGKYRSELLKGGTLGKAIKFQKIRPGDLNEIERTFIEKSAANEKREKYLKLLPYAFSAVVLVIFALFYYYTNEREALQTKIARLRMDSLNKAGHVDTSNNQLDTGKSVIVSKISADTVHKRALAELNAGAHRYSEVNAGPFVKKYLQAAGNPAVSTSWKIPFVVWCFIGNDPDLQRQYRFMQTDNYGTLLRNLTAFGYVLKRGDKPQQGDIVFLEFRDDTKYHAEVGTCGLVTKVDRSFVYTIEGDVNNKVERKKRNLTDAMAFARIP